MDQTPSLLPEVQKIADSTWLKPGAMAESSQANETAKSSYTNALSSAVT